MPSTKSMLAIVSAILAVGVHCENQINVYTYHAGNDCDNDNGQVYGYETYSYGGADMGFNAPDLPSGVTSYDILLEDVDGINLPPVYGCPSGTAIGDTSNCYQIIGGGQDADSQCVHLYNAPMIQFGSS